MQVINASELFENIGNIYNKEFETSKNITLDFSDINNIDLKAVRTLLNIQKVAVMNNKSLSIKNVTPMVREMLDVTGLNKTFANVSTNPILRK